MKIEYKSLSIGVTIGVIVICVTLFILGNVETEFSFSFGESKNGVSSNSTLKLNHTIISYNIRYDNKWDK